MHMYISPLEASKLPIHPSTTLFTIESDFAHFVWEEEKEGKMSFSGKEEEIGRYDMYSLVLSLGTST